MRVLTLLARRFPPIMGAPKRPSVWSEEEAQSLVDELMIQFNTYLEEAVPPSRAQVPLQTPGAIWRSLPFVKLRAYASMICDGIAGDTSAERLHALDGAIRTKKRNSLGYVRSQGLMFLAGLAAPLPPRAGPNALQSSRRSTTLRPRTRSISVLSRYTLPRWRPRNERRRRRPTTRVWWPWPTSPRRRSTRRFRMVGEVGEPPIASIGIWRPKGVPMMVATTTPRARGPRQ